MSEQTEPTPAEPEPVRNTICPKCGHDLALEYEDGRVRDEVCGYDSEPGPEPEILAATAPKPAAKRRRRKA